MPANKRTQEKDIVTFREDLMAHLQRGWSIERRTILKSGAVIAAAQNHIPAMNGLSAIIAQNAS